MGDVGEESSSVGEARSSNTDYRSANGAEDNDGDEEAEEEEESSWTTYIVDFLINGQEKITPSSPLSRGMTSADALSGDPGFKRRKNKGSLADRVDDALEDTASSPIHTPRLMEDKGISSGNKAVVESGRGGGGGGGGSDSRLLKEKGLCLVPLSMEVNYLG